MRLVSLSLAAALLTAAVPLAQPFDRLRAAPGPVVEGQQPPATQPRPVFRGNTQIVSVDVIVRDGSGAVVRGLTKDDFEVLEDGKPQEVRSFAFEEISDHPKGVESAELLAGRKAQPRQRRRRQPRRTRRRR